MSNKDRKIRLIVAFIVIGIMLIMLNLTNEGKIGFFDYLLFLLTYLISDYYLSKYFYKSESISTTFKKYFGSKK